MLQTGKYIYLLARQIRNDRINKNLKIYDNIGF